MSTHHFFRSRITRTFALVMVWAGLTMPGFSSEAQEIGCAVAKEIAGRAYDRVSTAIIERNTAAAMANKNAFWDIEEYSRECEEVRVLAKALTDRRMRKEDVIYFPAPLKPNGGARSVSSLLPDSRPAANSVVTAIEALPRAEATAGSSAVGSSGATGSAMGSDWVYRVTVRMDDGTTKLIIQDKAPDFRKGDRVKMPDGVIKR